MTRYDAPTVKLSSLIGPAFYGLHREVYKPIHNGQDVGINEVWMIGGRGSLKSSDASIEIADGLRQNPAAHALVARRHENELNDSVVSQMKWAISELGLYSDWRFYSRPIQARNKRTGQLILFKGVEDPLKLKSIKLPFGYIKYLWCEEVDQFRSAEDLRNIEQSVFRGHDFTTLSIYTFNPPKKKANWANKEVTVKMDGRVVHQSCYLQAPKEWLGKRFIMKAEALKKVNEKAYRHEYLGEAVGTGAEIFENVHSASWDDDEVAAFSNNRQGLDWGFSIHPMALIRLSFDRKRMILKIYGELVALNLKNRQINDRVDDSWRRMKTYADSEEPKSCAEMREDFKWNLTNATKGKGSVREGIKWLQSLNRIEIDPARCPFTFNEFIEYAYTITDKGEMLDDFPDANNHSIDAARYACQEFMVPERDDIHFIPEPMQTHWN